MRPLQQECLKVEAVRLYHRYRDEVVLQLKLCPWAERAIAQSRVTEQVVLGEHEQVRRDLPAVIEEIATSAHIEVALVLLPQVGLDRPSFDRFAQLVREDLERGPVGRELALAAFHPVAEAVLTSGERLIPFLRRTPDPTLQFVRYSVLERVREGTPQGTHFFELEQLSLEALAELKQPKSLRQRISDNNLSTIEEIGVDTVEAIFRDIQRDREETYRGILES